MSEQENNEIIEKDESAELVFNTAVKTLFMTFLTVVLLFAVLFQCFPSGAMRFTYDIGLYKNSLGYAEKALARGYNLEALLYAVELSDKLCESELSGKPYERESKYADELEKYTREYAFSPDFDRKNAELDEYYAAGQNYGGSLYSYADYIYTQNFYARALLDSTDEILCRGELVSTDKLGGIIPTMTAKETAVLYNQMDAYLTANRSIELLWSDGKTALLDALIGAYEPLREAFTSSDDIREKLYLTRAALYFSTSIADKFNTATFKDEIEKTFVVTAEGKTLTVFEYYKSLLNSRV